MKDKIFYVASFLGTIGFMGVAQWTINPDAAPFAVMCGTVSVVPCWLHYFMHSRVRGGTLRIALLAAPASVFLALLFLWAPNVPDHEGGRQIARFLLLYSSFGWFSVSALLLIRTKMWQMRTATSDEMAS